MLCETVSRNEPIIASYIYARINTIKNMYVCACIYIYSGGHRVDEHILGGRGVGVLKYTYGGLELCWFVQGRATKSSDV